MSGQKISDMGARRLLLFLFRLTAEAVYRVARLVKTRWSVVPEGCYFLFRPTAGAVYRVACLVEKC